jgi:thiol:disulfide interchange protein
MRTLLSFFLLLLATSTAPSAQVVNSGMLQPPATLNKNLYPPNANAKADIRNALAQAKKEKKHVLVEFGALWCLDCHILDNAFQTPGTRELLEKNYILVHVDVGRYEKNLDLAKRYRVPLEKGIPAMAVLDWNGRLLISNKSGEFQAARRMTMADVVAFLEKWKPQRSEKSKAQSKK